VRPDLCSALSDPRVIDYVRLRGHKASDIICGIRSEGLLGSQSGFNFTPQRIHSPQRTSSHHGIRRCSQHLQKWHPFSRPACRHYNIYATQTGQVSKSDALSSTIFMWSSSRAYRFVVEDNFSKLISWCTHTDSQALVPCTRTTQR
jgi:hypothetical protein